MVLGVDDSMSNLTSAISNEASISSTSNINEMGTTNPYPKPPRKKRNLPGNPDPEAEVVALSPRSLMATNRFVCEICNKGFQRDQNLQLHRRGHNLPWKLKQRNKLEVPKKKVYVCPEPTCVHHDAARALGDLTGIKKHYFRKHGEKKWKCEKCSKRYAVQSDWKAHSKICGTREYRCDCGTLFSRRDSFITHRAFCDALAQESSRSIPTLISSQTPPNFKPQTPNFTLPQWLSSQLHPPNPNPNPNNPLPLPSFISSSPNSPFMSATALLQKAAQMGVTTTTKMPAPTPADNHSILMGPHVLDHVSATPPVLPSRDSPFLPDMPSFGGNMMMAATASSSLGFDAATGGLDALVNSSQRSLGGEELTRDFLGLRGFNFLNVAGIDQIGSSSSSYDHQPVLDQDRDQVPWQR